MDLSKLFENEEPGVFVEPGYKRVDCKVALSIEKPIYWTSDESITPLSQVKPISVQKLKELSNVLTENSIQNTISEAARNVVRQIDEAFRNVLKKRGITESQWKEYGTAEEINHMTKYYYKGEFIFFVKRNDFETLHDKLNSEGVVYYGEPAFDYTSEKDR